jgi:hypothetical protein
MNAEDIDFAGIVNALERRYRHLDVENAVAQAVAHLWETDQLHSNTYVYATAKRYLFAEHRDKHLRARRNIRDVFESQKPADAVEDWRVHERRHESRKLGRQVKARPKLTDEERQRRHRERSLAYYHAKGKFKRQREAVPA